MSRFFKGGKIRFFTINNRSINPFKYWGSFRKLVALLDANGLHRLPCFSANETLTDSRLVRQYFAENPQRTVAAIAVNPVYKHPFAAAKTVSALAYMYGRKTILNLITGASARDREFFDEEVSHEERYDRHGEYALLIKGLLSSKSVMRFDVPFYRIAEATPPPTPPSDIYSDTMHSIAIGHGRRLGLDVSRSF